MAGTILHTQSKATDVIVYLSGAQITRKASFTPEEGTVQLLLGNLPHMLQPQSLQVSAEDGVTILSVEHRINYLAEADKSAEIAQLQQELETLEDRLTVQKSELELFDLEEQFFEQNRALAGHESGLKASELKEAVLFYTERMADIRQKRILHDKEIRKLGEQIDAVRAQLGIFQSISRTPVSEVLVNVSAPTRSAAALTFSYYVPAASWQPLYDIRVKDTESPVLLHYKAQVSQNTGEDWTDVNLTLSTGNPSIGGACPALGPWYIDFYMPPAAKPAVFNAAPAAKMMERHIEPDACLMMDESEVHFEQAAQVNESPVSVEYVIKTPCSIAAGDSGQTVEIITHSLPARYHHFSVRKLEKEVFLLAAVRDWGRLNLVAGEASVFFENHYVGKTYIDPRRADDEINLSLGVDKSVIVTRVKAGDFTEKTLTGGSIKQTRRWELVVRNLKNAPVEMKLLDQIPVSLNKQLTVDAAELSGAALDKDTGILTWEFTLEPSGVRKMAVKYVVTHPKNATVVLD